MIESGEAVANIQDILAAPVSAIMVVPGDMSIDLGLGPRGAQNHPEVDEAFQTVLEACRAQDRVVCGLRRLAQPVAGAARRRVAVHPAARRLAVRGRVPRRGAVPSRPAAGDRHAPLRQRRSQKVAGAGRDRSECGGTWSSHGLAWPPLRGYLFSARSLRRKQRFLG